MFQDKLEELTRRDPRYAYEAYEFLFSALAHAQGLPGQPPGPEGGEADDITARQLLQAIRDLAVQEFGLLAATVFRQWGVRRTDDFGEIITNLVSANLMTMTSEDDRGDFHEAFDLDAMAEAVRIEVPREGEEDR